MSRDKPAIVNPADAAKHGSCCGRFTALFATSGWHKLRIPAFLSLDMDAASRHRLQTRLQESRACGGFRTRHRSRKAPQRRSRDWRCRARGRPTDVTDIFSLKRMASRHPLPAQEFPELKIIAVTGYDPFGV